MYLIWTNNIFKIQIFIFTLSEYPINLEVIVGNELWGPVIEDFTIAKNRRSDE